MKKNTFDKLKRVINSHYTTKIDSIPYFSSEKEEIFVSIFYPIIKIESTRGVIEEVTNYLFSLDSSIKNWILKTKIAGQSNVNLIGIGATATELVKKTQKIEGLTEEYIFPKSSPFTTNLSYSLSDSSIIIESEREAYFRICTDEDVENFNNHYMELMKEVRPLHNKVAEIAKVYDEEAYYDDVRGSLLLFKRPFPLLIKRVKNRWKIHFFKSYKPEHVIYADNLSEVEKQIIELVDKFSMEERYFDLLEITK